VDGYGRDQKNAYIFVGKYRSLSYCQMYTLLYGHSLHTPVSSIQCPAPSTIRLGPYLDIVQCAWEFPMYDKQT